MSYYGPPSDVHLFLFLWICTVKFELQFEVGMHIGAVLNRGWKYVCAVLEVVMFW